MKVTKIEKYKDYPLCDNLLGNGFFSDTVFDDCFIEISIDISDNPLAPLYRKLWEEKYIKIQKSITKLEKENEFIVGITISEALGFIYKATPTHMQHQIKDGNKSVNDIIETLKAFLLNDNSYIITSIFSEHIHIGPIATQWDNFDKIKAGTDLITSILPRGCDYGFYIYASTNPIFEIRNSKELYSSTTMVCSKVKMSNLHDFCKMVIFGEKLQPKDDSFQIKIDNIYIESDNVYIGLVMSTNSTKGAGTYSYIPKPYSTIINNSYINVK